MVLAFLNPCSQINRRHSFAVAFLLSSPLHTGAGAGLRSERQGARRVPRLQLQISGSPVGRARDSTCADAALSSNEVGKSHVWTERRGAAVSVCCFMGPALEQDRAGARPGGLPPTSVRGADKGMGMCARLSCSFTIVCHVTGCDMRQIGPRPLIPLAFG